MKKSDAIFKLLGYVSFGRNLYVKHLGDGVFDRIYIDDEDDSYTKTMQKGWSVIEREITDDEMKAIKMRFKELNGNFK